MTKVSAMALGSRLQHDVVVAERVAVTGLAAVAVAAFLLLAAGAAVYDIGKWLAIW